MDQSVMNFATSAARSSAIPTPTEGMTSYISTTGTATIPQIETYTGSAWQTPYGLTQVANADFSAAATVTVNNVFSTAYENYRVILRVDSCSSPATLRAQFQSGSGINYAWSSNQTTSDPASVNYGSGAGTTTAGIDIGDTTNGFSSRYSFDVYSPNTATPTYLTSMGSRDYTAAKSSYFITQGMAKGNTQFTNLLVNAVTATITGNIKIYGYRNS
jgi:hypothetical protein